MYELKTKPTSINPMDVIAAIPSEKKQADALRLLDIFAEVTGEPAVVWGEKQIGFGQYHYKYPTGQQGTVYTVGFAVTKINITLYLYFDSLEQHAYLQRLGKTTSGKSCIYVNKLSDIDVDVLKEMIVSAQKYVREVLSEKVD